MLRMNDGWCDEMIDWQAMLLVPARSAPGAYGQFEVLGSDLVSFGPNAFALLGEWGMPNGEHVVTTLCWAPDEGAARRAVLRDGSSDSGAVVSPPEALLAAPGAITYGQIESIAEGEGHDHGFLFARAGMCVGHYLSIKRFTYLFRSGALEPNERLYAVLIDPDPDFWEYTAAGVDLAALAHALAGNLPDITVDARGLRARFESTDLEVELAVLANGCCDLVSFSPGDLEPLHRHYEFRSTEHALAILQQELRALAEARSPASR
ncbi:MAG TPA: hypothetical protein VFY49_07365 [Myxococcota bacterium]|nr:hypothetical protein [Myxococcota bacterium]